MGSVRYENHANMLHSELPVEEGIQHMSISGRPRRRSTRLRASVDDSVSEVIGSVPRGKTLRHPRADQFCVYNTSSEAADAEYRLAAYIIEYKAPHKLSLGRIHEGLQDMDLDDVIVQHDAETSRDCSRRLVAAAITRTFSYMIAPG